MSAFGPAGAIAGSVAGQHQAERVQTKETRKREQTKPKQPLREDEVVVNTETAEAVRNLKDNAQEESREDRETGEGQYTPQGQVPDHTRPSIDVEG